MNITGTVFTLLALVASPSAHAAEACNFGYDIKKVENYSPDGLGAFDYIKQILETPACKSVKTCSLIKIGFGGDDNHTEHDAYVVIFDSKAVLLSPTPYTVLMYGGNAGSENAQQIASEKLAALKSATGCSEQ